MFVPTRKAAYGVSSPVDPFFSSVSLLLHADGANADTTRTFVESVAGLSPTISGGNPLQGSYSPYTKQGGSAYFDGASSISVPANAANNLGVGDFTIECWINPDVINVGQIIYDVFTNGSTPYILGSLQFNLDSSGHVNFTIANTTTTIVSLTTTEPVSATAWNHLAIVRSGGVIKCYINGTASAVTLTSSAQVGQSTGAGSMGTSTNAGGSFFHGFISDLRTNTTAIYTANFTPPTTPLTNIANTKTLYSFTNGKIVDSAFKLDFATFGSAQLSTTHAKFGATALSFSGTTDALTCLTTAKHPAFSTGDFTIEAWIYPTAFPGTSPSNYATIICNMLSGTDTTAGNWWFGIRNPSALELVVSGATAFNTGTTLTLNTWTHVAVVRASGTVKVYINGTQAGTSAAVATSLPAYGKISVGKMSGDASGNGVFIGFIDDVRVTVGVARYTANFTAPTASFPNR